MDAACLDGCEGHYLCTHAEYGTSLAKKSLIHPICVGICVVVFVLMRIPKLKQLHPGLWILAAAVVGVIFRL